MSAVFLVGVSVLLLAGMRALVALATASGARRFDLVSEVGLAVPIALPVTDVLVAAPKTSPPRW